jgi:5-methylcytosine-specific restriction protein A
MSRQIREREAERRAHALKSYYDSSAWRKRTRPFILNRDPLCLIGILCGGQELSTDVDHIVRAEVYIAQHNGDPTAFFDSANLQGACHADHSLKTKLENTGRWERFKAAFQADPGLTAARAIALLAQERQPEPSIGGGRGSDL